MDGSPAMHLSTTRKAGPAIPAPLVTCARSTVSPDHRRQGYATALLEAVIEGADCEVDLFVDESNEAAIRLYEALGFRMALDAPGRTAEAQNGARCERPSDG